MLSPSIPPRLCAALVALGALALPTATSARPVTANDFQITYRFTDDDGSASTTELQSTDLNYYVNRARCECGEQIAARVNLQRSTDEPYDDQQIRSYVGSQCDLGQNGFGAMNLPCVEMFVGQPNEYDDGGIDVVFDLVWLSSRVPGLDDQSPLTAEPINPCAGTQSGESGVWICAEDGMQTDCQSTEFIISGTQNQNGNNGAADPTGMDGTGSGGLVFDYLPPQVSVTGFESSPGDGAVVIRWERTESMQVNGFRVLCADMDGNPVGGRGASAPPFSQRTNGNIYFTSSNLCPGEVVYQTDDDEIVDDSGTGGDSGTGTGDFGDSGDMDGGATGTTGVGAAGDWLGNDWSLGGSGTGGTTGGGTDSGSGSGSGGSSGDGTTGDAGSTGTDGTTGTTGRGTDSGGSDSGGAGGGSAFDSPLASLDWDYVCSDHITGTGTSARVDGLQNGVPYQFIVVAYDRAGNPLIVSEEVMIQTPEQTTDFWEQCEIQGDLCGTGGFCQCSLDEPQGAAWLGTGLLLLVLAGLRRRGQR